MRLEDLRPAITYIKLFIFWMCVVLDFLVLLMLIGGAPEITVVALGLVLLILFTMSAAIHISDYLDYMGFLAPKLKVRRGPRKIYGFFTSLAVGIGSTIGTSTFVALPLAMGHYGAATIIGLAIGGLTSILLAVGYSRMFRSLEHDEEVPVGGPAFVKSAFGSGALYFTARFNLWVANTALSAFNLLMFYNFVLKTLFPMLNNTSLPEWTSSAIVIALILTFTVWFMFSLLYREKYSRGFMWFQVALVTALLVILFRHTLTVYLVRRENITLTYEFLKVKDRPWEIFFATAYTYLLIFGFQEIQSISNEMKDEIGFPLLSRVSRRFRNVKKSTFAGYAMGLTVLISLAFFIFYCVAVSGLSIGDEGIPMISVAMSLLGKREAGLLSIAFMSAILTTFVPAYIAASKHLEMLIADAKLPRKISGFSWLFTFIAALILATSDADFLIKTTDFAVLISMALIALSEINISKWAGKISQVRPITVSAIFLVVAFSFYFFDVKIVNYGIAYIFIAWFLFTLIQQGSRFVKLFLVMTAGVTYKLLGPALTAIPDIRHRLLSRYTSFLLVVIASLTLSLIYDYFQRREIKRELQLLRTAWGMIVNSFRKGWRSISRSYWKGRVLSSKYQLMDLAIKLESIRETNPELYRRLSTLINTELEEIEKSVSS